MGPPFLFMGEKDAVDVLIKLSGVFGASRGFKTKVCDLHSFRLEEFGSSKLE